MLGKKEEQSQNTLEQSQRLLLPRLVTVVLLGVLDQL